MACTLSRDQLIDKIYKYIRAGDILSIVTSAVDNVIMKLSRVTGGSITARMSNHERLIETTEIRSVQFSKLTMNDLINLCEAIDQETEQKEGM